jgi:hypothetical protein
MADLDNQTPYDAEQLVEEIAKGEEKAPQVNVEADYELSKQFDVAEIDRTEAGAEATATVHSFQSTDSSADAAPTSGKPEDYLEMAREVTPDLEA